MFKRLFSPRRETAVAAAIPDGRRVYAIGDIHGRRDLLDELLARIGADLAERPAASTTLVLLGDFIDRGPDSAGVIDRVRIIAGDVRALLGNHEEVLLLTLDGDERAARLFCRIGGRETALSYGIDADDYERLSYPDLIAALQARVPSEHRAFLASCEEMVVIGDYAFVHAGVRPDLPLDAQRAEDLRWIREPFLDHRGTLAKTIVHGHTIRPEVEFRPHRIGIDTGAYASGRLTALALEGEARWLIQTGE